MTWCDVFGIERHDARLARDLDRGAAATLHADLCLLAGKPPAEIGHIGRLGEQHHARVIDHALIGGARIPVTAEAWVTAERAEARGEGSVSVQLLINRSPSLAVTLHGSSSPNGLLISGPGLRCRAQRAKTADYDILISLISPYVQLTSDGKSPSLLPFSSAIGMAITKAAAAAHRAMVRPRKAISLKDAAGQVMETAYLKASDNGQLPANARQIMYAARPKILALTGVEKFTDSYFTQTLLPNYVAENPEQCADWDVVFDGRGHFTEPHTGRSIPVGTIAVREYLGKRPTFGPAVTLSAKELYPTAGPENRYRNVVYVEKEGFDPLLAQARIAERFDIAMMSNKGMSVTAARKLLDGLAPKIDRLFVLHDFDLSGFTIAGTLTTDGRRYIYKNAVNMIDLGLRLADVEAMGLQSEPVRIEGDRAARVQTLTRHGATGAEILFLLGSNQLGPGRVELNAMTSRQFVDFLERKLVEARVTKVVPEVDILEQHARRLIEQQLAAEALDKIRDKLAEKAADYEPPDDLEAQVSQLLTERPELSWDVALALILRRG
jgi:hypothetical protein